MCLVSLQTYVAFSAYDTYNATMCCAFHMYCTLPCANNFACVPFKEAMYYRDVGLKKDGEKTTIGCCTNECYQDGSYWNKRGTGRVNESTCLVFRYSCFGVNLGVPVRRASSRFGNLCGCCPKILVREVGMCTNDGGIRILSCIYIYI